MNHFGGKSLQDIEPKDILALVDNQTEEDQYLEFKSALWPHSEEGKFELLHDITGMANAEGGYLFLGIGTKKNVSGRDIASGFAGLTTASKEAPRIESLCFQYIDPRIQGLEVKPILVVSGGKERQIVAIHIPRSESTPHGFEWRDATVFVRRYGVHVRKMPISEIGEQSSVRYFPQTETNRLLNEISEQMRELRETVMHLTARFGSVQGDALAQTDVNRLLEMMERRFKERYEDPDDAEGG